MNNMKKTLIDEKEWPHALQVAVDDTHAYIECYPVFVKAEIQDLKIKVIRAAPPFLSEYIAALRCEDVTVHLKEEHAMLLHAELPQVAFTSEREVAA